MKTLILFCLTITIVSCKILGTYKWAKLNTKLNPELIEKRNSIESDPELKYSPMEVFELEFKAFGNLNYRFTNIGNEGGIRFKQDQPLNSGKWELNTDTLSIYFSVEKNNVPYLFIISGDTLIPLNNKMYWKKEK